MDPVVAAFGTALVRAMVTDTWQQVHEAVAGLGRRVHPRREDDFIGAELDELREQVLVARRHGNARRLPGPVPHRGPALPAVPCPHRDREAEEPGQREDPEGPGGGTDARASAP